MMKRYAAMFFCGSILALISSCSSGTNTALRGKIEGQGKLSLDPSNPYLAPNKFLSEEAEASETLKGFISLKGSPDHISFKNPIFSNPLLTLYYDDSNEVYILENIKKDWIVTTRKPADDTSVKNGTEPVSSLYSKKSPPLVQIGDAQNGSPADAELQKSLPDTKSESATPGETKFEDVFHLVRFQGESLEFIAQWYTSDISNTSRIRSINSPPPGPLREGTTIRIPSYLLKKRSAPSEDDVRKFISQFR
jgi:hypothetical protein